MKNCVVCDKKLTPNKYTSKQKICKKIECYRKYKNQYFKEWKKNQSDNSKIIKEKKCEICGRIFIPNKYSPRQKLCKKTECYNKYRNQCSREWRKNHPDYYKTFGSQKLKDLNKERQRKWRENNQKKWNRYMRDYRAKKKSNNER